jgi:hypothetical protein
VYTSLLGNVWLKCISPFIIKKRLSKHVPAATNTCNNRRKNRWVRVSVGLPTICIPLSLLDNSVKTFPRQRRIVGVVLSCAVLVVSKECRRLVLPKTSRFLICKTSRMYNGTEIFTRSTQDICLANKFNSNSNHEHGTLFDSWDWQNIFLFFVASGPALGPTQRSVQWVPGIFPPRGKRTAREADLSSLYSAEVIYTLSYACLLSRRFMV